MATYVKKTPFGYKEIALPQMQSDTDIYCLLEVERFHEMVESLKTKTKLVGDLTDAIGKLREAGDTYKNKYENARTDLLKYEKLYMDVHEDYELLKEELNSAKMELNHEKVLNQGLLRIHKERSNANRGLTPKKEHNGYLFKYSQQHFQKYYHPFTDEEKAARGLPKKSYHSGESRTIITYETLIETPYDAALPADLAEAQILSDLGKDDSVLQGKKTMRILQRNDLSWIESEPEENLLYNWKIRANYISGFWEIYLYTTSALNIPREYLFSMPNK